MAESDDITARDAVEAARIQADVGVEHVADVYAKGLLGAAAQAGLTREVLEDLDELIAGVLDPYDKLEATLASDLVSHEEKTGIIDRLFGGRLSPLVVNFLKVVSAHGRLDCLRVIHRRAHALDDELRGRVRVKLTTAAPMTVRQVDRVADDLRRVIGGEPLVEHATDPEIIGGAVLRIGDTIYDGSVANQLQNMRQQMIDRSAHEIQSRRDRFRYPAGN